MPFSFALVGKSGCGKTTLAEKLINELTSRGYRVGSIKYHGSPKFDIDTEGKDSWRHMQAGSVHTIIASKSKIAEIQLIDHEKEFDELIKRMEDVDIVLIESYRHSVDTPAINIYRRTNPKDEQSRPWESPEAFLNPNIIGIVTDIDEAASRAHDEGKPLFGFNDVEKICDLIERLTL